MTIANGGGGAAVAHVVVVMGSGAGAGASAGDFNYLGCKRGLHPSMAGGPCGVTVVVRDVFRERGGWVWVWVCCSRSC